MSRTKSELFKNELAGVAPVAPPFGANIELTPELALVEELFETVEEA